MSGYSKTPLVKKLGIKEGFSLHIINPPIDYTLLVNPLPENIKFNQKPFDFVHIFTNDVNEMEDSLHQLKEEIVSNGMIWVSWYKKSSGKQKSVNEDTIRKTALPLGLVDVKVCAVDQEWSGLKLVIRKENR